MNTRPVQIMIALLFLLTCIFLPPNSVHAVSTQMDSVNATETVSQGYWAIYEYGWVYVANVSYTMTRLETQTGSYNTSPDNRTVDFQIYDEPNGTLLASTSFIWSADNIFLGGDLDTPLAIVAGEDYFVVMSNISYMGTNTTQNGIGLASCTISMSGDWTCVKDDTDLGSHVILRFLGISQESSAVAAAGKSLPGPDMVAIPSTAVMGTFTTDTALFYTPAADAGTPYHMASGQSLWVFGLDATGQFYQVLLAGKFYWVPVSTLGPTYGGWWKGRPLPTITVQ